MRDTNTDFKVLKRIMTGELVRFDIFVIARLCDYLSCTITDIIDIFQIKSSELQYIHILSVEISIHYFYIFFKFFSESSFSLS